MARDEGKKFKATYGLCVKCENHFKHGEYTWADGMIFCKTCREKYDTDTTLTKRTDLGGAY